MGGYPGDDDVTTEVDLPCSPLRLRFKTQKAVAAEVAEDTTDGETASPNATAWKTGR